MLPPADTNDSTHNRRRRTARLRYVLLCMGVWAWGRGQVDGFGMRPSCAVVVYHSQYRYVCAAARCSFLQLPSGRCPHSLPAPPPRRADNGCRGVPIPSSSRCLPVAASFAGGCNLVCVTVVAVAAAVHRRLPRPKRTQAQTRGVGVTHIRTSPALPAVLRALQHCCPATQPFAPRPRRYLSGC